jgi:hypothetical protein
VCALKAVCCEIIRIKIWNKYLNDGIGVLSSELFLRAHQLRFYKHLEYQKLQENKLNNGKLQRESKKHIPDIWKGDLKMTKLRYKRLCEINKRLENLRPCVLKACKKHLQLHIMRQGDLRDAHEDEDEDEDEENWHAIFPNEAVGSEAEDETDEDLDDEFEALSEDNDSDYEG